MKLTVKSLKQVPYEVEVESDASLVKDLKLAVEKAHGFDSQTMKLVFNGQVLDDAKKLSECNIKEGNVVVMMSAKAKPINVQKEEAKTEEKVPVSNVPVGGNVSQVGAGTGTGTGASTTANVNRPQAQAQAQVQAKDYSNEVNTLMEFGFPKSECEAAIKAARGNVNIATEFLISGIPDNLPQEDIVGGNGSEVEPNSPLAVLRNTASIVKVLCYNNPSQLQNILLTLQQNSPELMELIRENEEEFKALIQQPITEDDMRAFQEFNRGARGESQSSGQGSQMGQGHGGYGQDQSSSGRNVIKLSKTDYDAVGRLKELGFTEMDAVQAYFACDKNEEVAANFLWENKMNEQQEQQLYIDCKFLLLIFISFL
jgi:UV excision repair protein RAD23